MPFTMLAKSAALTVPVPLESMFQRIAVSELVELVPRVRVAKSAAPGRKALDARELRGNLCVEITGHRTRRTTGRRRRRAGKGRPEIRLRWSLAARHDNT